MIAHHYLTVNLSCRRWEPWFHTYLLEEMGRPSFCHLAWNSGGMLPGQKSCTACPEAACTREGSEPAKRVLERWEGIVSAVS